MATQFKDLRSVYVDESIHPSLGFIATAFVLGCADLDRQVESALLAVGLVPGVDEHKSGAPMRENPQLRDLRDRLLTIAHTEMKIAVAFSSASDRDRLGYDALEALDLIVRRNGLRGLPLQVYIDDGIGRSRSELVEVAKTLPALSPCELYPCADSRTCFGIQVADAVAHAMAQIVRESHSGRRKMIKIDGPDTGYADDDQAPLSWALLTSLRYALLRRQFVLPGEQFDPETKPAMIDEKDDAATVQANPELLGWGVIALPGLHSRVVRAIEESLGRVWLGCIH